ncbi:MAG: transposase for insertion sequence element IS1081 [Actinomycetota bacterium]|nr:MAG: transposase for insertion sequence element IS1081 [Actinomycetota bacterium]GIV00727.1 MAG: transposase for insertion sequence element IS1081 [Actinomycetota bacterium]
MVATTMDPLEWLRKQLEEADADLLREMVRTFAQALMSAEADAVCGAPYGERSGERVNRRNGYRERRWDTRVGTIDLEIPKLRRGSYFPSWLLDPRRRSERALVQVVAECYVRGVSTRKVEGLVRTLGIEGISKSQVSELAKELDEEVRAFRTRPLDGAPYTYVWIDAQTQRVREAGRVVNVACVMATGVNRDGRKEVLGLDLVTTEDGAGWTAFLRDLLSRGLSGVELVTSDAHPGLREAIAATLPGASWQRCRTHFMRNLLAKVPKAAQPFVAALVRSIFAQPDREQVEAQLRRVTDQLAGRFPEAAALLEEAGPDITAFACFPAEHWRQIWSNNPQERLNREVRRRTDVVGIFPDRASAVRLVGMVLVEQHEEWQVARRYMSPESLARARVRVIDGEREEVMPELVAAG